MNTAIGEAGLAALAPALRGGARLPYGNAFGDEGLAALVAPPPPPAHADDDWRAEEAQHA